MFIAYLLAESNWLPGRENIVGEAVLGILTLIVFIFTLKRMYNTKKSVFFIFLLGIVFLLIGTFFDFMNDDQLPFRLTFPSSGLFEEVPELFASLFFLHSMFLLYLLIPLEKRSFDISKTDGVIIILCAILIGCGNSLLMYNHGQPNPLGLIILGIILYLIGLIIIIFFLKIRKKKGYRIDRSLQVMNEKQAGYV